MTNLFSTFDPQSWASFSLNWLAAAICLSIIPPIFWVSPNQIKTSFTQIIWSVKSEFSAILAPKSTPGFLTVPLALFIFIMINNSFGLIPYIFTSSSHLTFTIAMALPLWLGHMTLSAVTTPSNMLAHLVPLGTPPVLMPFMVLIETISSVIRPLTLSVRLAANMIAGHLLLTLLANNGPQSTSWILISILSALVLLGILECAVSLIQAYVFSVLSTLYLNEVNSHYLN